MAETNADRLRAWRACHGWTQEQAARACSVPVSTWRGWEAGKPMPQPGLMARLLDVALRCPLPPKAA